MRLAHASALAAAIALLISTVNAAPQAQDPDRKVAGGGITAPGWVGAIDAAAAAGCVHHRDDLENPQLQGDRRK